MTRGKIIFLGENNEIYTTVEFNGDMYPEVHGKEIIQAFKDETLQNVNTFYNYVTKFDKCNFNYTDCGEKLIRCMITEESGTFDVRNNWTDYLYIINESGKDYVLLTSEGDKNLSTGKMAIVRFQQLKMIKDRVKNQKEENTFLISKNEFVSVLERMKETNEFVNDINDRLRKVKEEQIREFCSGAGLVITNEECVLRLLSLLTEDKYGDIDYFVYELKYGEEYQEGSVTRADGSFVDLSCAEKLYEYLEAEKKDRVRGGRIY